MGNELTVTTQEMGITIAPEQTIEIASQAAKALKRVVSLKPKPVILNGEQYLEFEDLQLLGQFYGYTVRTGDAVLVDIDGVKGAKAHADLINVRTGEVIGGAEAYCMRDEEKWSTRPKYEWQGEGDNRKRVKVGEEIVPWFQLASMAQTRAGAKAFRNRLAWVVVLAGYRPTPAEEMSEGTVSEAVKERRTVDKSEHYCELHGINFFMKGKMKSYAHPTGDTGGWCHEHIPEPTPEPTKPPANPPPAKAPGTQKVQDAAVKVRQAPPASKPVSGTTAKSLPDGLEKDIKTLAPKVTGYQRENLIPYLDELSGNLGSESITSAYNKLTEEQQVEFTAQVAADVKLV